MIKTDTGLKKKDIYRMARVIMGVGNIREALVFGSRAKENYRPGSDIDLALKGDGLTLKDILRLSTALDDLDLPYHIDVVIYDRIGEPGLKDHIDRLGIDLLKVFESRPDTIA